VLGTGELYLWNLSSGTARAWIWRAAPTPTARHSRRVLRNLLPQTLIAIANLSRDNDDDDKQPSSSAAAVMLCYSVHWAAL